MPGFGYQNQERRKAGLLSPCVWPPEPQVKEGRASFTPLLVRTRSEGRPAFFHSAFGHQNQGRQKKPGCFHPAFGCVQALMSTPRMTTADDNVGLGNGPLTTWGSGQQVGLQGLGARASRSFGHHASGQKKGRFWPPQPGVKEGRASFTLRLATRSRGEGRPGSFHPLAYPSLCGGSLANG